jgi:hypothetical protein
LILSRWDGSIIKATGAVAAEKRKRAQSVADYQPATGEGTGDADAEMQPTPAEALASSIFQFMKIAGSVGDTLCAVSMEQEAEDFSLRRSDQDQKGSAYGTHAVPIDESQIQLLRLRIKHREVIIFPDPRYICCVVQRTGRQSQVGDTR